MKGPLGPLCLCLAVAVTAWTAVSCSEGEPAPIVEPPVHDAGADGGPDAGGNAGPEDAGFDAGLEDAGADAGSEDAGFDAGVEPDAGCFADAGAGSPRNVLYNPGFECGGAQEGWNSSGALTTETADPRSGSQAAKVTATAAGTLSLFPFAVPVQQATGDWCASAWVKGPAGVTARVGILADQDTNFSAPMTGGWMRLAVRADDVLAASLTLRVYLPNAQPGDTFAVDDVDLFRATTAACPVR